MVGTFLSPRGINLKLYLLDDSPPDEPTSEDREPLNTILMAFSSYGPIDRDTFRPLVRYLEPISLPAGYVLWSQGDAPDGLYIVEDGILRAIYQFADHTTPTHETMVPGTLAGELSTLSGLERNASCVVERDAKVWKLSVENLGRLQAEEPELAREFTQLVLKCTSCRGFFSEDDRSNCPRSR